MKSRALSITIVFALLAGLLVSASLAFAGPPLPDYKPVDVGPEIREWEATTNRLNGVPDNAAGEEFFSADAAADYPCYTGITKTWLSLDNFYGYYFFTDYHLIAASDGGEIWVQDDLSYQPGDPRPTPIVTCDQAAYLLGEFDNNIYQEETVFFGTPDFHDGDNSLLEAWGYVPPGYYDNSAGRQVVLVSNVRDDSYYDYTYPNYIAGFFSTTLEGYFDRNVMSIDSHDWANRVGPDGSRPYLYESVFAHEYQHLLHADYDSDEVNWINEGLSMFAEFLTGYIEGNDAYSTFEELPENSLTAWGDQGGREIVADYGIVFLYHMYLFEQFGPAFIQDEFLNLDNDISSIKSSLTSQGLTETFEEIYHDFSVAVLIDSDMDVGQFGFDALDVAIDIGHPGKRNPDAYDTPGAPPWGTDYYLMWDFESVKNFKFNGYQFNPTPWTSDGDVLYAGSGDLIDNFLIAEVNLTGVSGAELTFDTMFQIEPYWDYGYVQVSTNGGSTWSSLENAYTTYDHVGDAHPDLVANLPGLTGDSGGWVNMSFDLSAYDGEHILVAFRYMTDWGYNDPGWYIDNVDISGGFTSDGSSIGDFKGINEILGIDNSYTVIFVGERNRKGVSEYEVITMMTGGIVSDWGSLADMFDQYRSVVMLVTFDALEGETAYAEYEFELVNGGGKPFKKK